MRRYFVIGFYCALFWGFLEKVFLRFIAELRADTLRFQRKERKQMPFPRGRYFLAGVTAPLIFICWPIYIIHLATKVVLVAAGYRQEAHHV